MSNLYPEAKQLITQIVDFLNRDDMESRALWHVLTALRGPDSDSGQVKELTTARLRAAIGLRNGNGAIVNFNPVPSILDEYTVTSFPSTYNLQSRIETKTGVKESAHFAQHVKTAVTALIKMGFIDPKKMEKDATS